MGPQSLDPFLPPLLTSEATGLVNFEVFALSRNKGVRWVCGWEVQPGLLDILVAKGWVEGGLRLMADDELFHVFDV